MNTVPVFVDIDPFTFNIYPEGISKKNYCKNKSNHTGSSIRAKRGDG